MEYSIEHYKQVLWSSWFFFQKRHWWQKYEALHMASNISHMEYSIWPRKDVIWSTSYDIVKLILKHSIRHQNSAIWSTPYGSNSRPYGVLHKALKTSLMELFIFLSQKTLMTKLWSTPYGLEFMPYGVLHMASKSNHMEYSIWQYIESFGVDSKALHMTSEKRHMEYSIWSLFDAIWSTPCGHYFLPYGVLHMVTVEFIFSRAKWPT